MFSGIIEHLGKIVAAERLGAETFVTIDTGIVDPITLGESIAVNGVCLTALEASTNGQMRFFVSAETNARSNLSGLTPGKSVNIERAVTPSTRLSGHIVQGHVDGQATVRAITPEGEARRLTLDLPDELARYCVEKGSITLDGISLTLNGVDQNVDGTSIWVTIIPHTWLHTNLSKAEAGSVLNVEVDVMAKYVEQLCRPYLEAGQNPATLLRTASAQI